MPASSFNQSIQLIGASPWLSPPFVFMLTRFEIPGNVNHDFNINISENKINRKFLSSATDNDAAMQTVDRERANTRKSPAKNFPVFTSAFNRGSNLRLFFFVRTVKNITIYEA